MPTPKQIMRAVSIAQQHLSQLDQHDERLRLDTIEGQSDAMEIIDALVEDCAKDRLLAKAARERASRLDKRGERTKSIVLDMLDALGLNAQTIERPLATIWVQYHASVVLTGPVPAEYMHQVEDTKAIHKALAAGKRVDNATLSNPEPSLHFLTK